MYVYLNVCMYKDIVDTYNTNRELDDVGTIVFVHNVYILHTMMQMRASLRIKIQSTNAFVNLPSSKMELFP